MICEKQKSKNSNVLSTHIKDVIEKFAFEHLRLKMVEVPAATAFGIDEWEGTVLEMSIEESNEELTELRTAFYEEFKPFYDQLTIYTNYGKLREDSVLTEEKSKGPLTQELTTIQLLKFMKETVQTSRLFERLLDPTTKEEIVHYFHQIDTLIEMDRQNPVDMGAILILTVELIFLYISLHGLFDLLALAGVKRNRSQS